MSNFPTFSIIFLCSSIFELFTLIIFSISLSLFSNWFKSSFFSFKFNLNSSTFFSSVFLSKSSEERDSICSIKKFDSLLELFRSSFLSSSLSLIDFNSLLLIYLFLINPSKTSSSRFFTKSSF